MISLALKISVQILKMEVVMERIVDTQLELYNTTEFRSFRFHILGTGNLILKYHFMCQDGSWVCGLKAMWSGKLSDSYTTVIYMSITKLEKRIVDVDGTHKPGRGSYSGFPEHRQM